MHTAPGAHAAAAGFHARHQKDRFGRLTVALPPPSRRDRVVEVGHIATPPHARIAKPLAAAAAPPRRSSAPVSKVSSARASPPLPKSAGGSERRRIFAKLGARPAGAKGAKGAAAGGGAPSSIMGLLKALALHGHAEGGAERAAPGASSGEDGSSDSESSPPRAQLGTGRLPAALPRRRVQAVRQPPSLAAARV